MRSKLEASRLVTQAGGSVIIASGRQDGPLTRILAREPVGTLFLARGRTQGARHRWIGLTARPRGYYVVDPGARRALESGTRSLLAIGVLDVVGEFDKGDVVGIRDSSGQEFARGLTNYATPDARQIRGLRTEQVRRALLGASYAEVVHRDNLVLTL
jgi:glutamate 5-kinase